MVCAVLSATRPLSVVRVPACAWKGNLPVVAGSNRVSGGRGHPDRPRSLERLLQLEGHLLARHPALMIDLGEVHLRQLPGSRACGLGVQEVVEDDTVERGLEPDLHGPGQR